MPVLKFEEFKDNQQLELDQLARLCKEIEDKYGIAPENLEEEDRQAFRRVFDFVARAGHKFQLQLHSPRALCAAYIEYLEGEVAEWVSEMEVEREDTIEAGYEPLATDGAVSGIQRLYEKIERQRERLRATPEHTMPMPRPWCNPFVLIEERPASEQWPDESAALDAPDALQSFPWLALEAEVDFRAFTQQRPLASSETMSLLGSRMRCAPPAPANI